MAFTEGDYLYFQHPGSEDDPLLTPVEAPRIPTAAENYEHILGRMVIKGDIDAPEALIALDAFEGGTALDLPIDREVSLRPQIIGPMYEIPGNIHLAEE